MNKDNRHNQREKSFIIATLNNENQVYLTDISEKGCQLYFDFVDEKKITSGNAIQLEIEIPEFENNSNADKISLTGKIMWIKSDKEESMVSGISFSSLDPDNKIQLNKILYYWKFLNSTFGKHL